MQVRLEIWRKRAVFWLSLVLLSLLLWVFGEYLNERLAEAEATSVRVMLNNLRSQLVIEQSTALAAQQDHRLDDYEGQNPFELTANRPGSFEGECPARTRQQSRGKWCYAEAEGAIYYKPRFDPALPAERGPDGRYGWRLELNRKGPGLPQLQLAPMTSNKK